VPDPEEQAKRREAFAREWGAGAGG
jgi:hypothetical protein